MRVDDGQHEDRRPCRLVSVGVTRVRNARPCSRDRESLVGARAGCDQELDRLEVTGPYRKRQRCEPDNRSGMQVGPLGKQKADHRWMHLGRRGHQEGLSTFALRGAEIRPVRDQHLDYVDTAGAHRRHERRLACGPGLRIRSGVEEPCHDVRAPVGAGQIEGRHAVVIGHVDVSAGADQELHRDEVVTMDCPVQRGRAVGFGGVDLRVSGVEQRAQGRRVPRSDGGADRFLGRGRRNPGGWQEDQYRQRTEAVRAHHRDLLLRVPARTALTRPRAFRSRLPSR